MSDNAHRTERAEERTRETQSSCPGRLGVNCCKLQKERCDEQPPLLHVRGRIGLLRTSPPMRMGSGFSGTHRPWICYIGHGNGATTARAAARVSTTAMKTVSLFLSCPPFASLVPVMLEVWPSTLTECSRTFGKAGGYYSRGSL